MTPAAGASSKVTKSGSKSSRKAGESRRESSLERHRQSYIRAWTAIHEAKDATIAEDQNPLSTVRALGKNDTSREPTSASKKQKRPSIGDASSSHHDDTSHSKKKKRRKLSKEGHPESQHPKNPSSPAKPSLKSKSSISASKDSAPSHTVEDENSTGDPDASSVSGTGLFVTPEPRDSTGNYQSSGRRSRPPQTPQSTSTSRLVPFPIKRHRRDVAFVMNAPDSPALGNVSEANMKAAARKTFGLQKVRKVYQSCPGVWIVRLLTIEDTEAAVGVKLLIGGVELAAERIPKHCPRSFAWRTSRASDVPSREEIVSRISNLLGPRQPPPEVQIQEAPCQVTARFSELPGLLRFYVELDGGVNARFDPTTR